MSVRFASVVCVAALLVTACKNDATIPHTPTTIRLVSGSNQIGDLGATLDSALVVQVVDGAGKSVSGVSLSWTVTGGGSLSSVSTTTDADGKSSVKWTLASAVGTQVATATSAQITGGSVSFIAGNGSVITGTVSGAITSPFATLARSPAAPRSSSPALRVTSRLHMPVRIVVGFKTDELGIAASGAAAYRSMAVAQSAMSTMRTRVGTMMRGRPVREARLSPALGAVRMTVDDTAQAEVVMATLRADANVAWVERDETVTIRDGTPHFRLAAIFAALNNLTSGVTANGTTTRLPNDGGYWEQLWTANMLDLPKAWGITTGSSNVIVASIDQGIRFDHPNMTANLSNDGYDFVTDVAVSPAEPICGGGTFSSTAGDGDGPDADPTDPDDLEFDDFSGCWQRSSVGDHGLWTAGIIGAVGNQRLGFAGVNWTVKIRPIRVLDITGSGSFFDVAQGVLYAAGLPATGAGGALVQTTRAPIINMSLGGIGSSTSLRNAVTAASNAGSLIVASAGNDGVDDTFPTIPATYPQVMAVAAVGMDGLLATYSNAGTNISVSAPGGDFRLDDNGGGSVVGLGWDFTVGKPTLFVGYGTSASAPFVSGIAALLLAQTPGLTAAQLRSRIEQFATRNGTSRSDTYGWGIANAYNALTQQSGSTRQTFVRLIDATSGSVARTSPTTASGTFAFGRIANGAYYVQAGDDEAGDGVIGAPGRRFGWAGGFGAPTAFTVNGNAQAVAVSIGMPTEVEPNDDNAHANILSVGSYVVGTITPPDVRDVYSVTVPVAGTYTFETSGLVGSCGLGVELDTFLSVASAAGVAVGTSNDVTSTTSRFCSRVSATLTPGTYYITVTASPNAFNNFTAAHGRYRLEVRSGT